jgi:hypothetical protein
MPYTHSHFIGAHDLDDVERQLGAHLHERKLTPTSQPTQDNYQRILSLTGKLDGLTPQFFKEEIGIRKDSRGIYLECDSVELYLYVLHRFTPTRSAPEQ